MAGRCSDTNLVPLINLLQVGGCFQNPLQIALAGISNCMLGAQNSITAILGFYNPPTGQLAQVTALQNGCTGFSTGALAPFQAHTDFLSGVSVVFPASTLASILPTVPNGPLLGAMSFPSLLGTVAAGMNVTSNLCQLNPSLPCAGVTAVFDTITGGFTSELASISTGICSGIAGPLANSATLITIAAGEGLAALEAAFAAFVGTIAGMTSSLVSLGASLVNQIVSDLTNLAASVLQTLNFGTIKLLVSLNTNPCFSSLISAIGTDALITALNAI